PNIRPKEGESVKLSDGTLCQWKMLQNPPKIINLASFFKGKKTENVACYAYGIINRPKAGHAFLTLGSDDAVKVWLNGRLIHRNLLYRGVVADDDVVEAEFNKGDNYLLFKIIQGNGEWAFTTRIVEDFSVLEDKVENPKVTLQDNPDAATLIIKSAPLIGTLTKTQPIRLNVYTTGGKSVLDKTIGRGDTVSLNYSAWDDGPYEIKYTYPDLKGLSCTAYLTWFKGDVMKTAEDLVKTAPEKNAVTPDEITHRMLADFVKDQLGNNFSTRDAYKISVIHPLLMEYAEMKAGSQIRPGGFIRLAYTDEIDGTPQFCRCYIPPDYDPSKKTALVVFLHGYNGDNPAYIRWWAANKRHDANVDRYNFILIEPHGRGNAQYFGIGDHDVMKCIQMAKEKLNIDDDRVYLTGASIGGGGTWRVASVHPELFAAIAPVYGGWDYRNSLKKEELNNLSEIQNFMRDRSASTCQFESLLNIPVLALHGDNDKTVDVENTRYLVRMLQRWGYDVRYIEVPGKGHENLGMDDVVYPWLLQHTRNKSPRQVRLRAADLRTASAYWVKVTQRDNPWQMINVQAEILANNIIRVNSDNVLEMVISPDEKLISPDQPVHVIWNGEVSTFNRNDGPMTLRSKEMVLQKLHKTPQLAGPVSDFTNTPFALVIGTISKDSVMQRVIRMKTTGFIYYWKNWQKFSPRVFKDTEMTDSDLKNYSLYLIGGPKENKISERLARILPFGIKSNTISVCGKAFEAPDAVLEAIYPSPFNSERYVRLIAPTSYQGMYFYDFVNTDLSGFDYSITDGKIYNPAAKDAEKKIGIVSGLFDYNWGVDKAYMNRDIRDSSATFAKRRVSKDLKMEIETNAAPDVSTLNSYAGTYKVDHQEMQLKFIVEDNKLLVQMSIGQKFETVALSESEFLSPGINIVFSFQRDEQRKEFFVNIYQGGYQTKCFRVPM
ncbi:MAG TPA: prolyl oligopeptidase family serine peptidase, partial [Bacteroidales bacterium]